MSLTGVTGRRSCSTQDHRQHTPATSLYCLCCVHSVCVSAVQCELHLRVQTHLHNLPYILPSRPPAPLSAPPGPDSRRWAGRGRGHSTPRRQRPAPRPLPQGRHRAVVPLLKPPQLRLRAARPWPRPRYRPHPLPATVPSREQRGVPGPDKNRRESAECWIDI